jgi:two-component system OmpR family sensor kinase
MNTRSLRFQLIVWYAGLLTGVFLLFGLGMYLELKHYLESGLREAQTKRAEMIGNTLIPQIPKKGVAYLIEQINTLYAPEINDRFIRITRPDSSVLYASGPTKDQGFDPTLLPVLAQLIRAPFSRRAQLPDGKELLIVAVPFAGTGSERYLIETGAPLGPMQTILGRLLASLIVGLPIVVAVAVGGGRLLVKRALAPVDQITRSAERITLHNLSERLPLSPTGDELERLSFALNHMICRLDEAFQHNRRFMADASHELRTPLTIMRGELESVVQQAPIDPAFREVLGSVLEEVERLAKGRPRENGPSLTWQSWPSAPRSKCVCWRKTREFRFVTMRLIRSSWKGIGRV